MPQRQELIPPVWVLSAKGIRSGSSVLLYSFADLRSHLTIACLHTAQLTPPLVRILHAQDNSREEQGDVQKTLVGVCIRTQVWKILYNFDHWGGSGREMFVLLLIS